MADAIVSFVVQEGSSPEAEWPPTPDGTITQYATEKGIVYQSDNGGYIWYNDFPQMVGIDSQVNPLAFENDTPITASIDLRENIGAPNNAYYYCDVDVIGFDDGSTTADAVLGFDLYAEVDGGFVTTSILLVGSNIVSVAC